MTIKTLIIVGIVLFTVAALLGYRNKLYSLSGSYPNLFDLFVIILITFVFTGGLWWFTNNLHHDSSEIGHVTVEAGTSNFVVAVVCKYPDQRILELRSVKAATSNSALGIVIAQMLQLHPNCEIVEYEAMAIQ